jgi:hypothetical protein
MPTPIPFIEVTIAGFDGKPIHARVEFSDPEQLFNAPDRPAIVKQAFVDLFREAITITLDADVFKFSVVRRT